MKECAWESQRYVSCVRKDKVAVADNLKRAQLLCHGPYIL